MKSLRIALAVLVLVGWSAITTASRTTTTTNAVAKYTDSSGTLGESAIIESATGNVGIGTTTPQHKTHIRGQGLTSFTGLTTGLLAVDYNDAVYGRYAALDFRGYATGTAARIAMQPTANGSSLLFGTSNLYDAGITNTALVINHDGKVGIGTTNPAKRLHVAGDATIGGAAEVRAVGLTSFAGTGTGLLTIDHLDTTNDRHAAIDFRAWNQTGGNTAARIAMQVTGGGTYLNFGTSNLYSSGITNTAMTINPAGNVGIGITTPAAKLHVAGDVTVTGNIAAKYQDVAEWVESPPLDAGTVVIVDPVNPNQVVASSTSYDTRVAGAVSAQPGLILGDKSDSKEMIAQSGRVRIKVDATLGAIQIGDLLVTSSTPGHAMRSRPMRIGDESLHRPGTILGKALEALPAGKAEILVLLTLQ